jgi:hypothetical protein
LDIHEIRLRGGWECAPAVEVGPAPSRLTLPIRADSLPAGRLRLTRRFNCPPRIAHDPVALRLQQVPGIEAVLLNGLPVGPISPGRSEFDLELGPLAPRNELVILAKPSGIGADWGVISLVFGGPWPGAGESPTTAPRP